MIEEKEIPKHWQLKKLRDVCSELQSGKRPKGGVQDIAFGVPSVGAEHLDFDGGFKFQKIKFVPKEFAEQMKKGVIKSNDIIVVKDGATTGKTSFVRSSFPHAFAVVNEHVFIVRVTKEVLPLFAFYKLFSATGHKEILEDFRGAAQGGISSSFLDKVIVPIPPIKEQQEIILKIEELLSDLENGKQQLQTAQQQLKVYRQSLLKWAFEGRLTNKNINGELPKGWKKNSISEVCEMKAGFFVKADDIKEDFEEGLFPCYGGNGLRGYVNSSTHEGTFPLVGRQGALCGNVHLVSGKFHATEHAVVVTAKEQAEVKWLYYKLFSMRLNQYSSGVAQPGLSVNKLLPIEISVPPKPEQQKIVDELESKLTVCDKIQETISNSLQQAEMLKQSILKKALEGKLI